MRVNAKMFFTASALVVAVLASGCASTIDNIKQNSGIDQTWARLKGKKSDEPVAESPVVSDTIASAPAATKAGKKKSVSGASRRAQ